MSTQRIQPEPHDTRWADSFARESSASASALGTADLSLRDERSPRLAAMGDEVLGEFGIPGRRYFRKDSRAGERTPQIHAFQAGSPQIARHLLFRDHLRAHPDMARDYDALKHGLAAAFPNDIGRYTKGKDCFVRDVDARAAGPAQPGDGRVGAP